MTPSGASAVAPGQSKRIRERFVVDTKFNAGGFYEIWIGRTPNGRTEFIVITFDAALFDQATEYYGSDVQVDVWVTQGRVAGTSASHMLDRIAVAGNTIDESAPA